MKYFFKFFLIFFCIVLHIFSDDKKEIEDTIDNYFKSWSKGDISTYGSYFLPNATIHFKEKSGRILSEKLNTFLDSQIISQSGPELLTEVPLTKKIETGKELSFARVSWKLSGRGRTTTGMDYFIFIKSKDGWKIHYLLFTND